MEVKRDGGRLVASDPAEQGQAGLRGLLGWATMSADEAEAAIEAQVTDMASAKVILKKMARAIVYLRDIGLED